MPRDVNLGEGYVEGEMTSPAMPGQHRGQFEVHDGSTVLISPQQMGDLGRPRGRGRGRGWGRGGWGYGYGPVFYEPLYIEQISDRKPFILDESTDESDEEKKKAKNLKGLADANDCISKIVAVAGAAAREAVQGVQQGIFKSMDDVADHIRRRVCAEFTAHGRTYILAMQEAMKSALATARPQVEKALSQKALSQKGLSGMGRCCGRGMGDLKSDVAAAIASKELDELMSGVRRVQDALIDAINARPVTLKNYQTAAANYDAARSSYSDGADDALVAAQKAVDASVLGVQFFARQIQTLAELQIVFGQVSAGLMAAGLSNERNAVDQTLSQLGRFIIETDNLFSQVPEYSNTKYAIISAFNRELSSNRVNPNDYSNRGWFQSYMNAVEKVVPLPKGTGVSGLSGLRGFGGMGSLGNPMAPALVALIILVAGVVATVVAIKAINKMAEVFNSKAETARQLVLQRDQNWASMESQMRAQGATEDQIDAARAKWNAQTKSAVDQIPESPSIGGSVGIVAGILLAAGVGLKAAGVL
jgi:hypothetical protein